jgi:hypothetical protein
MVDVDGHGPTFFVQIFWNAAHFDTFARVKI